MAKNPLPVSTTLAALLKQQRQNLNLSLRDVEEHTRRYGEPIPFTTLGKVERGVVDPGAPRLNLLCKIYGIPIQVAADALDMELPVNSRARNSRPTPALIGDATNAWKSGNTHEALAILSELRARPGQSNLERQQGLLNYAIVAGSLGKHHLSSVVVDELLLEPPEEELLLRVLVQAAVCWHRRGSGEVALGLLSRARAHLVSGDHQSNAYVAHETASVMATIGQLDEAEKYARCAIVAYRAAGNSYGEGGAMAVLTRAANLGAQHAIALERSELAIRHAERNGLGRQAYLGMVDQAQALIALGRLEEANSRLDAALAKALLNHDDAAQFFIYHARWCSRRAGSDRERAKLELGAAQYALSHVDEDCPEVREVRATLRGRRSRR